MNVVIYARYSSHNQTEQSIEGQLKVCHAFAEENGMTVIDEYIDRAKTATSDKRPQFQKMIHDSRKHSFNAVLVYQLDRFARNRYDSAMYRKLLYENGVRVISAKENFSDDASGKFAEGLFECAAEYYSNELAQKIVRGMEINAEKCLSTGSNPGIGFRVDSEKHIVIDDKYAPIVLEIFERFARGENFTDIKNWLNSANIKTHKGNPFDFNAVRRVLTNKRYTGTYIYKDIERPDAIPRIVSDDLFNRVQAMINTKKLAPSHTMKVDEYLLTTKLFCGKCKEMMVGYSGYGKMKKKYNYYKCKGNKTKKCDKKIVAKDYIENLVIEHCLELLSEKNIKTIAKKISRLNKSSSDSIMLASLKRSLKDCETAIENLYRNIEQGMEIELLSPRLHDRIAEKEELEKQIAKEESKKFTVTEAEIHAFLSHLKKNARKDNNTCRTIVNIFINAIYLYDDKLTIVFNASNNTLETKDIPLDDIENAFENAEDFSGSGSSEFALAPPKTKAPLAGAFGIYALF